MTLIPFVELVTSAYRIKVKVPVVVGIKQQQAGVFEFAI